MRLWLSGPRIGWFRPGNSIGSEDNRRRLPSWRRDEYREALKAYAAKHGQSITNAQANHDIDRAVALGELDAAGPMLHIKGSRQEIIEAVMQTSEKFGTPVTRAEAERLTDRAIRDPWPRRVFWVVVAIAALLVTVAMATH
jgi:hypothetical protein